MVNEKMNRDGKEQGGLVFDLDRLFLFPIFGMTLL
jgi:hypothetical protein